MVDATKFEAFLRMYSTRLADFERRAERLRLRSRGDGQCDQREQRERVRRHVRRVRRRFDLERDFLVGMATAEDC